MKNTGPVNKMQHELLSSKRIGFRTFRSTIKYENFLNLDIFVLKTSMI